MNRLSRKNRTTYNHQTLEPRRQVLRFLLDQIGFRFLVKIDRVEGLENFPMEGPGIIIINHIAFVDPIVVLGRLPRNIVPMAKVEVYQYPIVGIFPRLWDVIPVHREDVDRQALRKAFQVLEAGEVILLAPEGTRNPSLRRGREGVAYIGARSGVPIIPIAVTGTQGFPSVNPALWRSPGAKLRIGVPFKFRTPHGKPTREQLRVMTDEAMYVLAEMLPEELRGEYKDLRKATSEYIEPIPQLEGCHQG